MKNEVLYQKLAHLAVRRGVNVQHGQPLIIRANVRDYAFVEMCAKEAYEAGASYVDVDWKDTQLNRLKFQNQSEEVLKDIPDYMHAREEKRVHDKACFLNILSDEPGYMKGIDPLKIRACSSAWSKKMQDLHAYTTNNEGQWCVIGLPSAAWAKAVFPDLSEEQAYEKLEAAIFMTSRVNEKEDPLAEWENHDAELIAHAKKLTSYQFEKLHFTSELGTDLFVNLVKNHIWVGGGDTTPAGVYFDPNIPTEEVFCMPDRNNVNGIVHASKPLSYGGTVIENFWFRFEKGRVEEWGAEKGKEALDQLIAFDEGSRHLGEVALVPYDFPISKSGILFFNTLFDENAACHLALGRCYPENVGNGIHMSEEELKKAGGNTSLQHVDFMFGTREMEVDGIQADGTVVPVFRHGNYVD